MHDVVWANNGGGCKEHQSVSMGALSLLVLSWV